MCFELIVLYLKNLYTNRLQIPVIKSLPPVLSKLNRPCFRLITLHCRYGTLTQNLFLNISKYRVICAYAHQNSFSEEVAPGYFIFNVECSMSNYQVVIRRGLPHSLDIGNFIYRRSLIYVAVLGA